MFSLALAVPSTAMAPQAAIDVFAANARAVHAALFNNWDGFAFTADVPGSGTSTTTVALRPGFYRSTAHVGALTISDGFDGQAWHASGAAVMTVDLPGLQRDATTRAYVLAQSWITRPGSAVIEAVRHVTTPTSAYTVVTVLPYGGSSADLWFDESTHLLHRSVLHTDYGVDSIYYDRYRAVKGVILPFRTTEIGTVGDRTTALTRSIRVLRGAVVAVNRPPDEHAGSVRGTATMPFTSDAPTYMAHIILPIRVARRSVNVIFDSGGQNSLTPATASALGLHSREAINVGGSGAASERATVVEAPTVWIGTTQLHGQNFIVFPLPYQIAHPAQGTTTDGIIGSEVLQNFRVRIDYAQRTVSLSALTSLQTGRGLTEHFLSDGTHAYVWARIDGVRGIFSLDTGDSAGLTIFGRFAKSHHLYQRPGVRYQGLGIGGQDAEDAYRGTSFELGGVLLKHPVLEVSKASQGDYASATVAGNIGADILSRFTLTFDYRERTVSFLANRDAARSFRQDCTGMTVVQTSPGSFRVVSIAPTTPAALAGMKVGDAIVGINGRPAGTLGVKDFDTYRYGNDPFTLMLARNGARIAVMIRPRLLL